MGSQSLPIVLLVVLLVVFYLVVLRPARRQQQETASVQRNLDVGDDVVLSAGIFGTIVSIDDARVRLEIAPGTVIEVARQVVVRKAEPDAATSPVTDEADEAPGESTDHTDEEPGRPEADPSPHEDKKD